MSKTVVIGSDHAGVALKKLLSDHLAAQGYDVVDVGPADTKSVDYPIFAARACDAVLAQNALGILICGTGLGMSMTANRRPGIRAALCANEFMARMARLHNDANILCLGERVLGQGLALAIADAFFTTDFEGGRHKRRLDLMESCHDRPQPQHP
ncbi:ribose 5-phosphate isomerase B [Desulfolutivibrio sulfoxidireducens]|uniref:ribose 5-phosphate isomerase B n=1 Tax=Desulfolutivibrio sulfoxidireducens TaxID=2773299 RepID=UPI00159D9BAD|nr:ribose 5-phosphate isomerase B [Desulfolutivibrio sulfoxidireducens]QLA16954.1 ribose 5-phosphate isomerase B [Desulfolutivibrio sulfoxidireducens]QLA20521.1 ribose 5-phosphate isomerase B [Desulfolutivibrio sulfoxidireducens]